MGSYRRLFVFLTLVAALLAAPAMSMARTTPPQGRSPAPAPSMPPGTASTTRHDMLDPTSSQWLLNYGMSSYLYDDSSATAAVSSAGAAAALSVAGVMAMMLF
ncbi:unnamed protein product [Alopecurus aequalis]